LENLDDNVYIHRTWENIKESIKTLAKESLGYYELKQHKPWSDEECSKSLNQRKQEAKQWLQNPNQINGDNLKRVMCEISRTSQE
jgi:hypothetical protein